MPLDPSADLCDIVERDFAAAWWLIAEAAGLELHEDDGLRWFHSGAPDRYMNVVLTTQLPSDVAQRRIGELASELARRAAPFVWWAFPSSRPSNLEEILVASGLVEDDPWPGMAVSIDELVEPPGVDGLEIRRVADPSSYDAYERVFGAILSSSPAFTSGFREASIAIGFEADAPEVHFVGYLDGEPVATTSLITAGGAAGIYNVTTVEGARRRGIGAALTAHAVSFGGRRGMDVATLQASSMGRPVYERLGFRPVCDLVPYRSAG